MKKILFLSALLGLASVPAFAEVVTPPGSVSIEDATKSVHGSSYSQLIKLYSAGYGAGYVVYISPALGADVIVDGKSASTVFQVGGKICNYDKPWHIDNAGSLYCISI